LKAVRAIKVLGNFEEVEKKKSELATENKEAEFISLMQSFTEKEFKLVYSNLLMTRTNTNKIQDLLLKVVVENCKKYPNDEDFKTALGYLIDLTKNIKV